MKEEIIKSIESKTLELNNLLKEAWQQNIQLLIKKHIRLDEKGNALFEDLDIFCWVEGKPI